MILTPSHSVVALTVPNDCCFQSTLQIGIYITAHYIKAELSLSHRMQYKLLLAKEWQCSHKQEFYVMHQPRTCNPAAYCKCLAKGKKNGDQGYVE